MNNLLPEILYGKINNFESIFKDYLEDNKGFVIADENTINCRNLISSSFLFQLPVMILKAGEEYKSLEQISSIWSFLNTHSANRNDIIFLLGGGVVGDMGAFAASTYKRGLKFVNIPTSLLAMVDASIGGKTGFNFNHFKNNIGTFNHPEKIFCDVRFLKTLPREELLSGLAEVFKHAIIGDKPLWKHLKENDINSLDYNLLIKKSAELKLNVVKQDINEKNLRKVLNLGHTVGHALESYLIDKKQPIKHGFAVAKGIIIESYFAFKKSHISQKTYFEIKKTINSYFGKHIKFKFDVKAVISLMRADKKNSNIQINFSMPIKIGEVKFNQEINEDEVKKLLLDFLEND